MEDWTSESDARPSREAWFDATRWTVVRDAGRPDTPQADAARARLCQRYWYPIYYYLRRLGQSPEDAQDLTQEFFARLLEKNLFQAADREKGKFRSFLLLLLKRFLAHEWRDARRKKRGGGHTVLSLDEQNTECRYRAEPADELTPEKAFARQWALTLLEQVHARLQQECAAAGKGHLFAELKGFLAGERGEDSYAAAAQRLQIPKATLKVLVHRFRKRYGELLRQEIAPTVSSPQEVEEEIHALFAALS
jgi:RNA polymerase sigma-70 factor (ECF subfamily)